MFSNAETVIRITSMAIQFLALIPGIIVMIMSQISVSARDTSYVLHYIFCAIGAFLCRFQC
jgi:hypothetical protein